MAEELRKFLRECGLGERWFLKLQDIFVLSVEVLKSHIQGIGYILLREAKGEDVDAIRNLIRRCQNPMMEEVANDCSSQSTEEEDGKAEGSADERQKCSDAHEVQTDLLHKLGLTQYFPEKITLQTAMKKYSNKNSCLADLPWYFLTKILMLDYTGRDELMISQNTRNDLNADSKNPSNDGSADVYAKLFSELHESSSFESNVCVPHPLDVLITVFRCSSNFLRQIISEKLFMCKLSVPLVLPPFIDRDSSFLLWALRNITLEFHQPNGMPCGSSVVNHPIPFVSCLRLGEISRSKSKFLNEILNSEGHPTFQHRECENGLSKRTLSDGLIEVAWRLPSPKSKYFDNLYKQVAFLNLRGDGLSQETSMTFLCQMSNTIIVFVDVDKLVNQVVTDTLKNIASNKAEVVLMLTKKSKGKLEEKTMRDIQKCVEAVKCECNHFGPESIIFDFGAKEEKNIKALKKETEKKLGEYLENSSKYSFESHKDKAESLNIRVDENIPECKAGQKAASKVMEKACEDGKENLKIVKLPLQCEPWQEWTKLLKEQHQRKKKSAEDLSSYMDRIYKEKKGMRKKQVCMIETSNNSFDIFLELILQLNSEERLYYLKWIKFYVDDISREMLPGIQRKCADKWNEIHEIKEDDMKDISALNKDLSELEKERAESSFGLEHFMREAAQAYEAVKDIGEVSTEIKKRIVSLPRIMAELMSLGYPLELMDGDAANVPLSWINAVFEELRQLIGNTKIFVLSVLGVQSSGKSTMLNTMFGLKFAVAAGRCTRGVYAQLVPISKDYLHEKYDYLLVIDTEGLRAAELQGDQLQHDNEIATLVVGLGDVTLVNIRGESVSDMEDVLQIVTHALLKMKLVNKKLALQPWLFFIHQNVPAHDAAQKLRRGQEIFMKTLDRVTQAAGKQEDAPQYTKFSQLIDFDINTNISYFSNLWKGDPPMAPANPGYSKNVNEVKHVLLTDIMQKRTLCFNIEKFRTKLNDIWNGILDQDFVFSFKNRLEMEAYISLDEKLSNMRWSLRRRALQWQSGKENEIESSDRRTEDLRNSLESECHSCLAQNYNEAKVKLEDIFTTDEGSSVIEQWRSRTFQRLDNCHDDIIRNTTEVINSKLKVRQIKIDLRREMQNSQGKIMEEAKQVAENISLGENGEGLTDEELKGKFSEKWDKWIMKLDKPHEDNINIEERVNMILYGEFPHDYTLVKKALEDMQIQTESTIRRNFEEAINLYVSQEYNVHKKDASEFLKNVLAGIKHFVAKTQHNGFKGEYAENLIEIANDEIHGLKDVGFISSDNEEKFSISMAICTCQYACYEYSKECEMERVTDGNYRLGKFGIHPYFEQELLKRFLSKLMPLLHKTQQKRLRDFTIRMEEHVNFQGKIRKEEAETYAETIVNKLFEDVELYFLKTEMKEFREEHVEEMIKMVSDMESKDEYLTFKKNFKIQMAVHVCYFALPIFYKNHKRYNDSINPKEMFIKDYYETYFQMFKDSYDKITNETALSKVVSERLSKAIEIAVDKDMARELAEDVRNNAEEVKSKPAFLKAILHELLVVDKFEDFYFYLTDTKASFQRWILYFVDNYLYKDGNNRYSEIASRMIKNLISQICEEISKSVANISKELSGQDELQQWVKEFHKGISNKLAIPLSDLLTLIQGYDIHTFDSFAEHLMNDLKSSKAKLTDIFHKHTKEYLRNEHEDSVYKIIFQECKGCTEQCPFCHAPCTLSNEEHIKDGKKHLAKEHYANGCGGWYDFKTKVMMVTNCTTDVISNQTFRNTETNMKQHPFKKYQEIYPDWKIDGDPSVEASPYWKWFLCKYESQLTHRYNADRPRYQNRQRPNIPEPWRSITQADALESIDKFTSSS